MILDSTNKSLQLVLGASVTTTQLSCVTSWADISGTAFAPGSSTTLSSNTTAVTIVAAPASGVQRQIKDVAIYNADSVNATVEAIYNDNSSLRTLVNIVLQPGETLQFAGNTWSTIDGNGRALQATSASGTAGGDLTGTYPNPVVQKASAAFTSGVFGLTDASTITVDASKGNTFTVTLGGNRTVGSPSNAVDGQRILFEVKQDSTGSRTLTWNSIYDFGSGSAPTLSTTTNATDYVGFVYNAATTKWKFLAFVSASGDSSTGSGFPSGVFGLTDASTITVDASKGNTFTVTLGGNRTMANPTNLTNGQRILFEVKQDSTGSRTLTWGTAYDFGSGSAPTLTTTAGATDYVGFIYNSSSSTWKFLAFVPDSGGSSGGSDDDSDLVTLDTAQTITGRKTFTAAGDNNSSSTGHWTGSVVANDITIYPNSAVSTSASMFLDNNNGQVWEFFSAHTGEWGVYDKTSDTQLLTLYTSGGFNTHHNTLDDGTGAMSVAGNTSVGGAMDISGNTTVGGTLAVDSRLTATGPGDNNSGSTGHWSGAIVTNDITVKPNTNISNSASMFLDNNNGQVWEFFSANSGEWGVYDKTSSAQQLTLHTSGEFTTIHNTLDDGSGNALFGGGLSLAQKTVTSNYTIGSTDSTVFVGSGASTITLPTASGITGRVYTIKNLTTSSVSVGTTSSQTIDGSTTYSLSSQYQYVTVQSDGENWLVIGSN